jgi:hypothetical protein
MKLYIELKNGQPINHPMLQSNMEMIYPVMNLQNLPENFCEFVRVDAPVPKWDEVVEGPEYKIIDGICYDVWTVNKISDEKRQQMLDELAASNPYPSWTVDTVNYNLIPPTPYPEEGAWVWNEETVSWVEYIEPTDNTE